VQLPPAAERRELDLHHGEHRAGDLLRLGCARAGAVGTRVAAVAAARSEDQARRDEGNPHPSIEHPRAPRCNREGAALEPSFDWSGLATEAAWVE
jgi:hypothetical protein